jgi:hypothetical protein
MGKGPVIQCAQYRAIIGQVPSTEVVPAHQPPQGVAKLISKLRWMTKLVTCKWL